MIVAIFSILFFITNFSYSQTRVDVITPVGGFEIDGDLRAGTLLPDQGGDWVIANPPNPSYGYVLNEFTGVPLDPDNTTIIHDVYGNTGGDNIFTGGSKAFQDPALWTWTFGNAGGKGDVDNTMYHLAKDDRDNQWIFIASDRRTTTGTSYLDFEFYQ